MSDQDVTCGACGATNAATAVVCAACGALLAAYATPAGAGEDAAPDPAPAAESSAVPPVAPAAEPVASAEALPGPGTPSDERRISPQVIPPTSVPADPEISIPVTAVDTQVYDGMAPEPPPGPEPGPGSPGDAPPPADIPLAVDTRWQQQWSTAQDAPGNPQVPGTATHRLGQAPMTGVPRLNRLEGWGPRQFLTTGIGLLIGACVFFPIGTSASGGSCLIPFAVIGGVVGALLVFTAARSYFGSESDWE